MKTLKDITYFIQHQHDMLRALYITDALGMPDCWIAAGFIRNAIWDYLHGRPYTRSDGDVDVIYFDPLNKKKSNDVTNGRLLRDRANEYVWSVKNQAYMHARNRDKPYRDTADAMAHWPETCTAIAAREQGARVELLAPFGIDDLVNLRVRPTPAFAASAAKMKIYHDRIQAKAWTTRWPLLDILSA